MRFDDFAVLFIAQEDGAGHRTLNDAVRVWPDGRVEQLGWPRYEIHYTPGHPARRSARRSPAHGRGRVSRSCFEVREPRASSP